MRLQVTCHENRMEFPVGGKWGNFRSCRKACCRSEAFGSAADDRTVDPGVKGPRKEARKVERRCTQMDANRRKWRVLLDDPVPSRAAASIAGSGRRGAVPLGPFAPVCVHLRAFALNPSAVWPPADRVRNESRNLHPGGASGADGGRLSRVAGEVTTRVAPIARAPPAQKSVDSPGAFVLCLFSTP